MNLQTDVIDRLTYDHEKNYNLLMEALDRMVLEKEAGTVMSEEDEALLLLMVARSTEITLFQQEWMNFDVSELDGKKYLLDRNYSGELFCHSQECLDAVKRQFTLANDGDVESCMQLAQKLSKGYFSQAMSVYASRYWKIAAEKGDAQGMYNYGMCFRWGEYGEWADPEQAIYWFRKAAEAGYQDAADLVKNYGTQDGQNMLMSSAISGAGGFGSKWYKSRFMAEKYFEGADAGNAEMQYELARQSVPGTTFDAFRRKAANAVKYYEMAAKQGMIDAMFNLANLYRTGCPGLEPDNEMYLQWMRQCADAGDAEAGYLVGKAYLEGELVAKDVDFAREYLRMSSDKGYIKAYMLLRECTD